MGCEFFHKSLLEKYTGSYFYNYCVSACLILYISKSLLLFCWYLKIYTFKCAACNHKHLQEVQDLSYVLQRVLGSILSDVNFFLSFFTLVSLKMLVYILLQDLRFV